MANPTEGFYSDQAGTALTASFVYFAFGHSSTVLTIYNDQTSGSNSVIFSFDGTNVHGQLFFANTITWQNTQVGGIWLKYGTGAPSYRVMSTYDRS